MKCSVCGRKLRNPKSQKVGYGPVCYRRLFGASLCNDDKDAQSSVDVMTNYEVPGQISLDDFLQAFPAE